jgi:hypothetical protein
MAGEALIAGITGATGFSGAIGYLGARLQTRGDTARLHLEQEETKRQYRQEV